MRYRGQSVMRWKLWRIIAAQEESRTRFVFALLGTTFFLPVALPASTPE